MKLFAVVTFATVTVAAMTHASSAPITEERGCKPLFTTIERPVNMHGIALARIAGLTIPTATAFVQSPIDGNTFPVTIVGTNPTKPAVRTTIAYVPIVIRWHFPDGVVLDATKPGCGDTVPVDRRFLNSPLFQNMPQVSNGVDVGNTQAIDAFQRAEFWRYVHGTDYHVLLRTTYANPIVVDENAPTGSYIIVQSVGICTKPSQGLGAIDINAYDALLQSLAIRYTAMNQLPVILSYNVVETAGSCCILGYHSIVDRGGIQQPYATGAYLDPGWFTGYQDIAAWSHEIGELFNDPYVNNVTPAWGHTGQVPGCQSNFEIGDPLSGTVYLEELNGFTYHPQELTFFSWFYRTPSSGTRGLFSYKGTFTSAQPLCG